MFPTVDSPLYERGVLSDGPNAHLSDLADQFHQDGLVVLESLIEPELTDAVVDGVATRYVPDVPDGPDSNYRTTHAWREVPAVRSLALHPGILGVLEALYGRRPIPYQTLNFRAGSQQRAHADTFHFTSHPSRFMCGVWTALEDIDEENGPLFYHPGSHRLPVIGPIDLGMTPDTLDYPAYEAFMESQLRAQKLRSKVLTGPRGTTVVWAANLAHGGLPIMDPARTRHSQVTHYFFEDCIYYAPPSSDPLRAELNLLPFVDMTTGEWIPQLVLGKPLPRQQLPSGLFRIGEPPAAYEKPDHQDLGGRAALRAIVDSSADVNDALRDLARAAARRVRSVSHTSGSDLPGD